MTLFSPNNLVTLGGKSFFGFSHILPSIAGRPDLLHPGRHVPGHHAHHWIREKAFIDGENRVKSFNFPVLDRRQRQDAQGRPVHAWQLDGENEQVDIFRCETNIVFSPTKIATSFVMLGPLPFIPADPSVTLCMVGVAVAGIGIYKGFF